MSGHAWSGETRAANGRAVVWAMMALAERQLAPVDLGELRRARYELQGA